MAPVHLYLSISLYLYLSPLSLYLSISISLLAPLSLSLSLSSANGLLCPLAPLYLSWPSRCPRTGKNATRLALELVKIFCLALELVKTQLRESLLNFS